MQQPGYKVPPIFTTCVMLIAFTLFSTCVSYHPNILIIKGDYKCIPKHSTLKKVFKMQCNSAAQWSATEAQGI